MTTASSTMSIFGVLLAATTLCSAPAAAQQTQLPPGSYQQSCRITDINAVRMGGYCRDEDSDWNGTGIDYKYCVGDIYNFRGHLLCAMDDAARNADQAAAAAAQQAQVAQTQLNRNVTANWGPLRSAALTALGRGGLNYAEAGTWLTGMKGAAASSGTVTVTFAEALAYLKSELAKPANSQLRLEVISRGFAEVYGRQQTPTEQAQWDARLRSGSNYIPLVGTETQRLNESSIARTVMITVAYRNAMGRAPTQGDLAYWRPRRENYRFIMVAARDYLYSENGAADLAATVARAIERNTGSAPSPEQVSQQMAIWSEKRRVYSNMM